MTPPAPTTFKFTAKGHENIQASHQSTIEVTTDSYLTLRGDCIIGVASSNSAKDLTTFLEPVLRLPRCRIRTILKVGALTDTVIGWVSSDLLLSDPSSIVWRTSTFVDERTIAIRCDKAAKDLDRQLVTALQNPQSVLEVQIVVDYET
jgi:hypothetical protein